MVFKETIKIKPNYFIEKIDKGIDPKVKSYVRGKMTDWFYFVNDAEFLSVYNQLTLPLNVKLQDAWGTRLDKEDWVQSHNHNAMQVIACGLVYLTEGNDTVFPDLNIKVKPAVGTCLMFSPQTKHQVTFNKSNTPRYSISFNLIKK